MRLCRSIKDAHVEQDYSDSRKGATRAVKSFVDSPRDTRTGKLGYGTHVAWLSLKNVLDADLYIAKISRDKQFDDMGTIAKVQLNKSADSMAVYMQFTANYSFTN